MGRWKRRQSSSRRSSRWGDRDWIDPDTPDGSPFDDDLFDDDPLDDGEPEWVLPQRLPVARAPAPRALGWKDQLDGIASAMRRPVAAWPAGRELEYVISVPDILVTGMVALDVGCRQRKKNGEWRRLTSVRLSTADIEQLPDPDRWIIATLSGDGGGYGSYPRSARPGWPFIRYSIPTALLESVLPVVLGTGRAMLRISRGDGHGASPLAWDDGPPWEFRLEVRAEWAKRQYEVTGALCRGDERVDLAAPVVLLAAGVVFFEDRAARLAAGGAFAWISHLRKVGTLRVPVNQGDRFLQELLRMPEIPRHAVPPELAYERIEVAPGPRLRVQRAPAGWPSDLLRAALAFDYAGVVIDADRPEHGVLQTEPRRLIVRSPGAERAARERLAALGIRDRWAAYDGERSLGFAARALPKIARTLLDEGWHVEADGGVYRKPGRFDLAVTSGIDWFELHGTVDFEGEVVQLPALLAALRHGDGTVRLGDGTYGLLPEEWLRRYAPLAALGTPEGDHLRFRRTQVGVLDALVTAQPEVDVDAVFARARAELRRFEGVTAADPPAGFTGRLRDYQRDALGWFHFLRRFGFGGCLADDMGLGKTVMVLALLESRRAQRGPKPSLVVVPRSLVFNWKQEATRFAPGVRVLDHTGVGRRPAGAHFADHDVVLTTYGTLRRDAGRFKDVEFDYVVLDEAQAIKNAGTDAAKAARLLRGDYRLGLSGTPIENHLGELWSLFEFLNPGMLGAAGALGLDGSAGREPDEETRTLLARALRPFILRRTKAQVAPELPSRTEQTVYCELEPAQRRLYDELRDHYRRSLLARVDEVGIARSKIVVLEALLRLRQAACHPGLIDRRRVDEPAGKLDVLLPRLQEVLDEGHKAIVFSQFTSFLAIVRRRLDGARIPYEYLDGATRDRQARVTRFQTDPDRRLFLISLKAGGLGLNLTAAEHVFLLDPWWNPAVEAQAIDRTHRIGQTRPVLAFRLIAPDTVEEKILALQRDKRDLAEAIVNAQNSLIRTLTREDLELLLS